MVSVLDVSQHNQSSQRPLLGMNQTELTTWVQAQGQPAYRGKQLHQWLYAKGIRSFADITVFPKNWRQDTEQVHIGRSEIHHRSIARDQTVKFLLRLDDGHIIEAVGMPTDNRLTVCVSSQVGCPMACDFCATGKGGFIRNLAIHEIVDQVLTMQEAFDQRISNIVFMGMGEPLINAQNVVGAVKCLNQDIGIGQRNITISTVGIPEQIRRLAQHRLQVTLAVSLHASNQSLRTQLIPSAQRYPLTALLDECREYVAVTGRRVTFEYILLAGLNDSTVHADELAQMLRGFQSHVNLIPYNPIDEVDYKRPSRKQINQFTERLKTAGTAVSVRYSRGVEKDAACGQLRASKITNP